MGFLTDLSRALYDFKGIAQDLSRRSLGQVFGVLLVLSVIYGSVTGIWYANALTDLLVITTEEARTQVPPFTIENGKLTSPVKQPYVVTEHTLSETFFTNLGSWLKRRFHVSVPSAKDAMLSWTGGADSRLFCLVLDTTDTYEQVVKPEEYQVYVVADKDSIKYVGENQSGMSRSREVMYSETQRTGPLTVSPDMIRSDVVRAKVQGPIRGWLVGLSILFTFIRFAFKALFVGLFGLLLSMLAKKELSFGRTFAIAVYALVPVVICGMVKVVAMPYPGILLFLIHLVYGLVPVLMATSEERAATS